MSHPLYDQEPSKPEATTNDNPNQSAADDALAVYDNPIGKPHPDDIAISTPSMSRHTFMRIMGFDDESVRANQQGFVTQAQRKRLHQTLTHETDAMRLYFMIFIGTMILIALIMQGSGIPMIYLIMAGVIFFGAFFFVTVRRQSQMNADSNARKLSEVAGIMQLRFGGLGEDRRYWLHVGDERFRLGMETFRALAEHSTHGQLGVGRIFYAPESRIILGGELYDDDDFEKRKNHDITFAEKLKNHEPLSDDDWRGWDDFDLDDDAHSQKRQ